jgi:hypothetical protein
MSWWNSLEKVATVNTWILGVAALFGFLAAVFIIAGWFVGNRLSGLQDAQLAKYRADADTRIALANERAAIADQRAAEANRTAEGEKLARLKIEERLAPRQLTSEQAQQLQTKLRQYGGQSVEISYLIGDVESQVYADEIAHALGQAGWKVSPGLPKMFNFAGIAVRVQDPTAVPEPAEALAKAFEELAITVQRIYTPNKVEINGSSPAMAFDLWVSKKGGAALTATSPMPLVVPQIDQFAMKGNLGGMSNEDLARVTRALAQAMRAFETANREQFGNEWHVVTHQVSPGSYRDVFEQYRARAIAIRDEIRKRSGDDRMTTFALDDDTLAGGSQIAAAADYLEILANRVSPPGK